MRWPGCPDLMLALHCLPFLDFIIPSLGGKGVCSLFCSRTSLYFKNICSRCILGLASSDSGNTKRKQSPCSGWQAKYTGSCLSSWDTPSSSLGN